MAETGTSIRLEINITKHGVDVDCPTSNWVVGDLWREGAVVEPSNAAYALGIALKRTIQRWLDTDGLYDGPKVTDTSYRSYRQAADKKLSKETQACINE